MTPDTDIVAEVRAVREAYFAEFNYDLTAFIRHLQERQQQSGRELIPVPPRPADLTPPAGRDAA